MAPRIALISLYSYHAFGVRSLFSTLKTNNVETFCIFCGHFSTKMGRPSDREMDILIKLLKDLSVDIVGISVPSTFFKISIRLTEKIKNELGIPVIWGGMHPTINPEECIEFADFVFRGETENTLLNFINNWGSGRNTNIPGLWAKRKDKIIKGPPPQLIENLDTIPLPDFEEKNKYYIEDSALFEGDPLYGPENFAKYNDYCYHTLNFRGCPFNCSYCSGHVLKNIYGPGTNFIRKRSVNILMKELAIAKERLKARYIVFADECFASDTAWLKDFSKSYKKEICLPFYCEMHPSMINEESISMLSDAGMCDTCIGIQSGSEQVRNECFARPVSNKLLLDKTALLKKHNVDVHYEIITDNPFESEDDKYKTFFFLFDLPRPLNLNIFSLNFFPATNLTKRALAEKLIDENSVEGKSDKNIKRFLLNGPNDGKDIFWNNLYFLISDCFCSTNNINGMRKSLPKNLIFSISKSRFLKKFPFIFVGLIYLFKMAIFTRRKLCFILKILKMNLPRNPFLFIHIFIYSSIAPIFVAAIGPKKISKFLKFNTKKSVNKEKATRVINYTKFILQLWPWRKLINYCYVRSIILYYFLKREGLNIRINFGVRNIKGSLKGHAWLTLNEETYLEDGDQYKDFVVIHSVP